MISNFKDFNNKSSILILATIVMIVSGFCASLAAALVRLASQDLHPFQIAFLRSVLIIPLLSPLIFKFKIDIIKTQRQLLTFYRCISGSGAMLCFFYGISLTELSKA